MTDENAQCEWHSSLVRRDQLADLAKPFAHLACGVALGKASRRHSCKHLAVELPLHHTRLFLLANLAQLVPCQLAAACEMHSLSDFGRDIIEFSKGASKG